jgi:hypothetical protein
MAWIYDGRTDRLTGHDFPGAVGRGMHDFMLDEIEFGARVAMALDDPDQWWWELIGHDLRIADMYDAVDGGVS